ncbi:MAG TPA: acyl-CoA dehydrogenase family protein [Acidimicrobiales bacterium]|nr:acyl-CoA dehydrogenase family protein [Acidimicrobiales bacterium]
MELDLSSDQELLRDSAARFIDSTCPLPTVRELIGSETGLPADYLRGAGELGWFALLVPEEHGGGSISGEGVCDLAIIAEERGRALQPGPFVCMNVVAAALAAAGSPEQQAGILPSVRDGEAVATWVLGDAIEGLASDSSLTATSRGNGFVVSGQADPVDGGAMADWFLVTTGGEEGLTQFIVSATTPGIAVTPLQGLDITKRYASVAFDDTIVPATSVLGRPGHGDADVEHQLQLACVLSASETVGATDALFEITRRYAVERTAFGRPIGSFQAVKHQLADMSLSLEAGKAISTAAVRAVQEHRQDAGAIASIAKSWVSDTGVDIAQGCAQVFAGIGFTWEHDLHLFLRRITMNGLLFGQSDRHRERLCRINGI